MRLQYLAFGSAMLAVAVIVCVESASLVIWTPIGPGPGFFTVILGAVLGALAIAVMWEQRGAAQGSPSDAAERVAAGDERIPEVIIARFPELVPESVTEQAAEPAAGRVSTDDGGTADRARSGRLWLVIAALIAVPFILEPLGFRLTVFALLLYLLLYVERRRVVSSVLVAAGASAITFYLFSDLLAVPLPIGVWGV